MVQNQSPLHHWGLVLWNLGILAWAAPSGSLINPQANSDARDLMAFLMKSYQKNVLSGQMGADNVAWVTDHVGKTPAIAGFDMMDYSPSRLHFGASSQEVEKAITWAQGGGIVTFSCHWGAPDGTYNMTDQPWFQNYYTTASSFDVGAALNNPNGLDYQYLIRDIDTIAVQLKRLQAANVPVLWRPLHEADGGWFWWGAKGPGPFKQLYALLYDRLTNHHQLNNLIWVWNSIKPDWYAGNDAVDIVSTDFYANSVDHSTQSALYNQVKSICNDNKLIALSECGGIPDQAKMASEMV